MTPATSTINITTIRWLTYVMFLMFALTTDAVGVIIPEVIKQFGLSLTEAGAFHYATMAGIALAGLFLGFLADQLGRKITIILGLSLFGLASLLFSTGQDFVFFLVLLFFSGLAIGIFKTGALALIGDISSSTKSHTQTMNTTEGFFGIGAIIGPALVTYLLHNGLSWKWLYVFAAALSLILILTAALVRYPSQKREEKVKITLGDRLKLLSDPFAIAFSIGAMLYVGVEAAIYVWMPTLLKDYSGPFMLLAVYALSVFFILRAIGRFLGAWMLSYLSWTMVLLVCSLAIFICFIAAILGGQAVAVYALPLSGLFMSVIYPTLNSKGISCFPKHKHGAIGGIILFFTCLSAIIAPLFMAYLSDLYGHAKYGFYFATVLSGLLFLAFVYNHLKDPSAKRLDLLNRSQYGDQA